ncbi:hypothetical protein TVAG_133330 [Trichomonas vaginalis G3]|uniref:Surface antigen BspA-like n=1 Tax=Trichomonas vaginalis (strain ATCC PRA-98 / G3) TaxID=412133 RepID=A2EDL0_TRIV3|nr:antigen BSP-related family [Trichomonas vaginalis G3]EAY09275.1 hypothetical protein TVAG_133330 [Trichomonas vaginalis G3]KAI5484062.1 antigen BSP-related family [Trichomonas vaginalis G3]|eukprot:XP_001321498.1 hypothetical protein [Trichomonas vaginalis G3]
MFKCLFTSNLISKEIKINLQAQISNNIIRFNSNTDFSDKKINDQIISNNIHTISIENDVSEIKYFLGIEFIKNVNINTDHTVTLSDSLFYGSRNIESVTCTNNIVVGPKCFEQSTIRNIDFTKITEIGEDAFKNCFNIKSANLKSLTSIGNSAFASSGLESVIIPSTISKIPDHCFYQCPNLTNVEFKGPVDIDQYAFADCFQLSNVVPGFEQISHIKYYGFRGCSIHKLKFNDCELGGGVFQNSHVESIDATNLKIASKDFRGCRNLIFVNITGTLEIIDGPPPEVPYYYERSSFGGQERFNYYFPRAFAFEDCVSLQEFKVNACQQIGDSCFRNCLKLKEIKIVSEILGSHSFMNCISLETVDLRTVTQIGDGCFGGYENLKSIIGLETSREYGGNIFSDCPNLVISEVGNVGWEMFSMCHSIINVVFNGNTLEPGAFMNCQSLESFECQTDIGYIPPKCFYGCFRLINVKFSYPIDYFGNFSFFNTSLRNGINFETTYYMGDLAFAYTQLRNVTLYDIAYDCDAKFFHLVNFKVREDLFNDAPFRGCKELTKVIFNCTRIPPMMGFFDDCENLREIEVISDNFINDYGIIYNKDKTILYSFLITNPLESFTVPESVQELYDLAFYRTKYLKNLTCNNILYIKTGAFLKSSLENKYLQILLMI